MRVPAPLPSPAPSGRSRVGPKKTSSSVSSAKVRRLVTPKAAAATAPVAEVLKGLAMAEANKAASVVFADLKRQADAKLEETSPKAKAVLEAIGPHAAGLLALTAREMANDPQAVQKLAQLSAKIGKQGFTKAMKVVGPDVSRAFAKAAGMEAMNPVVVAKLLDNLPALAAKVAPKVAPKVAKHCVALQAKLGVKTVVKTGAAAGKITPAVGNVIAVASTVFAAAGLIKSLGSNDAEKICKEGCNTLLQAIGIAFPWVALGGDLVDLGWTAKMAVEDSGSNKKSKSSVQEAGMLISTAAAAACEEANKAGEGAFAKALAEFSKATQDVSSRKQVEKASEEALKRLAQSASATFSDQAKNLPEGPAKQESELLAKSFGELFRVVLHHQKSPKLNDAKRIEDAGALVEILKTLNKD
jgi:hypothetical protein